MEVHRTETIKQIPTTHLVRLIEDGVVDIRRRMETGQSDQIYQISASDICRAAQELELRGY